jgi:CRP-like cAMP-binding protein
MLACLGAKVASFDKKYTIFSEGSPAKYVAVMLSGSAWAVQIDYFGNRSIISEISAGEVFAEAFACAELPAIPISFIANEPCEVMLIDCSHIMHTCSNNCSFHRQLIFNLMKGLAEKNILFHQRIEVTSKRSTREKLLAYLSICASKAESNTFEIPFDRQELADFLEVERSGLSAEISKMKKEGLIDNQKNRFTLL